MNQNGKRQLLMRIKGFSNIYSDCIIYLQKQIELKWGTVLHPSKICPLMVTAALTYHTDL